MMHQKKMQRTIYLFKFYKMEKDFNKFELVNNAINIIDNINSSWGLNKISSIQIRNNEMFISAFGSDLIVNELFNSIRHVVFNFELNYVELISVRLNISINENNLYLRKKYNEYTEFNALETYVIINNICNDIYNIFKDIKQSVFGQLITVKQACEYGDMSRYTIYSEIRKEKIFARKYNNKWLIYKPSFNKYLQNEKQKENKNN